MSLEGTLLDSEYKANKNKNKRIMILDIIILQFVKHVFGLQPFWGLNQYRIMAGVFPVLCVSIISKFRLFP
jgi:hypothetical protein